MKTIGLWMRCVVCGLAVAMAAEAFAEPVRVFESRRATCPGRDQNFAKESAANGALTLTAGLGASEDWGFAAAGVRIQTENKLTLTVLPKGTPKAVDENALTAVIVDFHTPSGYLKRVAYEAGLCSDKRWDRPPVWGKPGVPDAKVKLDLGKDGRIVLDLMAQAPAGWDGVLWLTAAVENTGKGTELAVTIPETTRVEGDTSGPAGAFSFEPAKWRVVPMKGRALVTGTLDGPCALALDKLREALPDASTSGALSDVAKVKGSVVIAQTKDLAGVLPEEAAKLDALLKDAKAWRERQGYVVAYRPERDMLIVAAKDAPGLLYGVAHVQRSLVLTPEPGVALEVEEAVEKPKLEERGIYINIGYGLSDPPSTPDEWNEAQWESFVDRLVLARVTFWSWYLWTEVEQIWPGSMPQYAAKNEHLFKMLKHAVDYSHKRGLRAIHLITPTNIPADIVAAHPDWKTTLEYVNNGGICSRVPEAYDMAKKVHQNHMKYLSGVDENDIAFYDPGGCMCAECRKGDVQRGELIKQIRDFSKFTWDINPKARFGFWTWAVWRYERIHNYSMKNKLLPEVAAALGDRRKDTVVIDSFHGDQGATPYFEEAQKLGFRTQNFVYQTNIEDGFIFTLPLLEFQQKWAAMSQEKGLNESCLMIMEVLSKFPMAQFGAEFFWDAKLSKDTVTARYALQLTGDQKAAERLQEGFLLLDHLTYRGALSLDGCSQLAARMRGCFEDAAKGAAPARRQELGWLVSMARAYEVLYKAIQARGEGNTTRVAELKTQYVELCRNEPMFAFYGTHYAEKSFEQFSGWLENGFLNGYF